MGNERTSTPAVTTASIQAALTPLPQTPAEVVAAIGTKNLADPAQLQLATTTAQRIAANPTLMAAVAPNFIVTNPSTGARSYDPRLDVGTTHYTADGVVSEKDLAARLVQASQYAFQRNVPLNSVTVDMLVSADAHPIVAAHAFDAINNADALANCGCTTSTSKQRGTPPRR